MRYALLPAFLLLIAACGGASGNGAGDAGGAPPATAQAGPGDLAAAGRYRLRDGPDVASALELLPDGRFRYFLIAGALDKRAEGHWTSDGRTVLLNTEPRPLAPVFSANPPSHSDEAPLVVRVTTPGGPGLAGIDLVLGFADGRTVEGYTQEAGWQYTDDAPPGRPAWVELSLAMYGIAPRRFALDPAAGNQFNFTLTPNDMEVMDFRDQALEISGRDLVLHLNGGSGTYAREAR
jgi:hypothetical protein